MRTFMTIICLLAYTCNAEALQDWTYRTDDGRKISSLQVEREKAACDTYLTGRLMDDPGFALKACMRAKGIIITYCGSFFQKPC
jgi:hypothetical protein